MAKTATWTKVAQGDELKRSSLCATVIDSNIYIFGGELKPRKPRDNHVHKVDLSQSRDGAHVDVISGQNPAPSPRVGAASTAVNGKLYLFSGRGGEKMSPIDENGHLWVLDPSSSKWSRLEPQSETHPPPRSYHCMTSDGQDFIYLHAGCPEQGRLSDLWSFDLRNSEWRQLACAPDPPRGGSSIAYADGKLYRMNGFDGKSEQGGSLDVYDPLSDSWSSINYPADGISGPGPRSVSALVPISDNGSTVLVTPFGESDPSSLGHQGAGKMLDDVWAYSLHTEKWSKVVTISTTLPNARGWFDADVVNIDGRDGVVVVGGLGEDNQRLDDVWLLK